MASSAFGYPLHDCPRCGAYGVVGTANGILPALLGNNSINRSVLSHLIRKAQRQNVPLAIFEIDLPSYQNAPPLPTPGEQADSLLLWVGKNQSSPDVFARVQIAPLAATIGAAISGAGEGACQWVLNHLEHERWVELRPGEQSGWVALKLTMKGWSRHEEMRHQRVPVELRSWQ